MMKREYVDEDPENQAELLAALLRGASAVVEAADRSAVLELESCELAIERAQSDLLQALARIRKMRVVPD